jgi:3-phenylpropionate/trans-cinnamate dioxygenase ferredoxin reductase subunit
MSSGVVIAGAGQGGFQLAASLRLDGYEGSITLIGDEPGLPYQRPPLSKGFMAGKQDVEAANLRPEAFYQDHRIDLLMGEKITGIDQSNNSVYLASGRRVPYRQLVLAVGARNRLLPVKGADLDGVCYLRTREEAIDIRQRLADAQNIVVIGGGFIGLELAAVASSLGKQVVVVEFRERVMSRVVAPVISGFYRELHLSHGVTFAFGVATQEIGRRGNKVSDVIVSDGTVYPADLVIVGIGVMPNTELAERAGLAVANGIVVDDHLRTGNENIYSIGDCALHPNRFADGPVRIESVQNTVDQARCVASSIVGRTNCYEAVPWFWTDQFDVKLQMAGLSQGCDLAVTRGVAESNRFSVLYFKQNRLAAIDSINRPADHMAGRKLLAAGTSLTPAQAADPNVDLKSAVLTSSQVADPRH